jgi:hypothetical protein
MAPRDNSQAQERHDQFDHTVTISRPKLKQNTLASGFMIYKKCESPCGRVVWQPSSDASGVAAQHSSGCWFNHSCSAGLLTVNPIDYAICTHAAGTTQIMIPAFWR